MHIIWNERSVRWFHQAAEYTSYSKELAKIIMNKIPHKGTLCDVGCGAAMVDYELAPYFESVTCVDIAQGAVDSVIRTAKEKGFTNMNGICMDAEKLDGSWDTVIALYHGGIEFFEKYYHLVKENLLLITHNDLRGKFGPKKYGRKRTFDVDTTKKRLDELGVRYELECYELECGQPFVNYEDAVEFVMAYTNPMPDEAMQKYINTTLTRIEHPKYSYYLPCTKKFGVFTIRREENPDF